MMNFSDETLMAYADGELDEPERSLVERAVREDPQVAASVARHRALRADVFGAFAGVLDEPVPARLAPSSPGAGASVTSLDAVRSARARAAAAPPPAAATRAPAAAPRSRSASWVQWGGMAASLAIGVLGASVWLGGGGEPTMVAADGQGRLLAQGALAQALSGQLASEGTPGGVRIGVSFAARDGSYCRSFALGNTAGLACREGGAWRLPVLKEAAPDAGAYRQAASATPAAVLEAIDERIAGTTLDAAGERAARSRGWQAAR